jgi:hypothetical protein
MFEEEQSLMPALKVGLVGCGRIAQLIHINVLTSLPEVKLVALAEPDPQRREEARQREPRALAFTDYRELLTIPEVDGQAIREILRYIIKMKHFDILSIYSFCLDDAFQRTLGGLGFRKNSLVRVIERKLYGELPLLIRPVKETYTKSDFFIEGVDMRRIENWSLKPICSDAA